jgi:hypothetical protein
MKKKTNQKLKNTKNPNLAKTFNLGGVNSSKIPDKSVALV